MTIGFSGHLDLTIVRPDGVTTARLRTWPDRVGEKIDPFQAHIVAGSRGAAQAAVAA